MGPLHALHFKVNLSLQSIHLGLSVSVARVMCFHCIEGEVEGEMFQPLP